MGFTFLLILEISEPMEINCCDLFKRDSCLKFYWHWLSFYSYDDLLREERTSLQEVTAMEKKFESWSQLPAPATAAADVKKAARAVTVSLPPAVAAFEVLDL